MKSTKDILSGSFGQIERLEHQRKRKVEGYYLGDKAKRLKLSRTKALYDKGIKAIELERWHGQSIQGVIKTSKGTYMLPLMEEQYDAITKTVQAGKIENYYQFDWEKGQVISERTLSGLAKLKQWYIFQKTIEAEQATSILFISDCIITCALMHEQKDIIQGQPVIYHSIFKPCIRSYINGIFSNLSKNYIIAFKHKEDHESAAKKGIVKSFFLSKSMEYQTDAPTVLKVIKGLKPTSERQNVEKALNKEEKELEKLSDMFYDAAAQKAYIDYETQGLIKAEFVLGEDEITLTAKGLQKRENARKEIDKFKKGSRWAGILTDPIQGTKAIKYLNILCNRSDVQRVETSTQNKFVRGKYCCTNNQFKSNAVTLKAAQQDKHIKWLEKVITISPETMLIVAYSIQHLVQDALGLDHISFFVNVWGCGGSGKTKITKAIDALIGSEETIGALSGATSSAATMLSLLKGGFFAINDFKRANCEIVHQIGDGATKKRANSKDESVTGGIKFNASVIATTEKQIKLLDDTDEQGLEGFNRRIQYHHHNMAINDKNGAIINELKETGNIRDYTVLNYLTSWIMKNKEEIRNTYTSMSEEVRGKRFPNEIRAAIALTCIEVLRRSELLESRLFKTKEIYTSKMLKDAGISKATEGVDPKAIAKIKALVKKFARARKFHNEIYINGQQAGHIKIINNREFWGITGAYIKEHFNHEEIREEALRFLRDKKVLDCALNMLTNTININGVIKRLHKIDHERLMELNEKI